MKNPRLTIAISTISNNFDKFICNFNFSALNHADEVLIVVQGKTEFDIPKIYSDQYIIIFDDLMGLSRSRNLAISRATMDYIWFIDDDLVLKDNAISDIKINITENNSEVFYIRMFKGNNSIPYKKYPSKGVVNKKKIISISSVEIIVSTQFLKSTNTMFNEVLGLGAKYPSCEENIFLLDLYDNGATIFHLPLFVITHPFVDRSHDYTIHKILFAKGIFCRRYGGIVGFLIMVKWVLRSFLKCKSILPAFSLIDGYKQSYYALS